MCCQLYFGFIILTRSVYKNKIFRYSLFNFRPGFSFLKKGGKYIHIFSLCDRESLLVFILPQTKQADPKLLLEFKLTILAFRSIEFKIILSSLLLLNLNLFSVYLR